MANNGQQQALRPIDDLKSKLNMPSVQEQFRNAMGEQAPLFVASIVDLFGQDALLQKCSPNLLIQEALKAASLRLPISKSLGFAWIVPYKDKGVPKPQFQLCYKGMIQLAIRSGQYRYINADRIYDGEVIVKDRLTGDMRIEGDPKSSEIIGYFAYIELINGFRKAVYWTKEEVEAYAKRFSKSYKSKVTPWITDFDAMALKTVLRHLLSKYGIMSVEMAVTVDEDTKADQEEERIRADIDANANQGDVIDVDDMEEAPPLEQEDKTPTAEPGF